MNCFIRYILVLFFISSSCVISLAQMRIDDNSPIICGNYRTIHSNVLGEDRVLLVRLPDDYYKSDKKYPVIFKLDGEKGVFLQTFSAAYYLFDMTGKAPDAIIVGIENTDRDRDMGPDNDADKFILFIKTELIPFIEKNYRIGDLHILCGQSYSAVFALYSFLIEPDLFDAYILSSFGLYNEDLAAMFKDALMKNKNIKNIEKKYLFAAYGKLDAYDLDGSVTKRGQKFLQTLKKNTSVSVVLEEKNYADEGHVPYSSLYDGLKWIYSNFNSTTGQ